MLSKTILIGRLGNTPSVKTSQDGKSYCRFTVATNSGYGDKKKTDWHMVTAFGRNAEACGKYLDKGSMVYVEGRLEYSTFEKDGQKHTKTEILADSVQFIPTGKKQEGQSQSQDDTTFSEPLNDEIPF